MRHRTLVCLLALTLGDYLLWHWSLAGNHDILSLLAGMTLLPLATLSLGVLVLATLGLLARAARASSRMTRSMRVAQPVNTAKCPTPDGTAPDGTTPDGSPTATQDGFAEPAEPTSSRRLAA